MPRTRNLLARMNKYIKMIWEGMSLVYLPPTYEITVGGRGGMGVNNNQNFPRQLTQTRNNRYTDNIGQLTTDNIE
jgi:hypothetical protein